METKIKESKPTTSKPKELICGLIMPISSIDNCSTEHWLEVKSIITEAIDSIVDYKFLVKLVSDSDESGVIQKRIIQNLYSAEIVVCDVSGKNPNVMFELGMRLAFDKPSIIVKDDKTDYAFDTGIIEHVGYPRDLRFQKIVEFKKTLANKIISTYKASISNPDHSTFLKNFGKFQVASLTETEVTPDHLVISMLEDLQIQISSLRRKGITSNIEPENSKNYLMIAQVVDAINKYLKESNISISDLKYNDVLEDFLLRNIDAPITFKSSNEFRQFVNEVIKSL